MTTATVCRVSGKLATDACRDVQTINADGFTESKSMVYTEYFARGTAPSTYCEIHGYGDMTKVAGGLGGGGGSYERPAAIRLPEPDSTTAPIAAGTSGTLPPHIESPAPEPPSVKKRGFWGRIFGRDRQESDTSQRKKKSGG